jgi:hypothetical protein
MAHAAPVALGVTAHGHAADVRRGLWHLDADRRAAGLRNGAHRADGQGDRHHRSGNPAALLV